MAQHPAQVRELGDRLPLILLGLMLCTAAIMAGGPIAGVTARGEGEYQNDPALLVNGQLPPQGYEWNGDQSVYWTQASTFFVLDLGAVFEIQDLVFQVDNNDNYTFSLSTNGTDFTRLLTVREQDGDVSDGLDIISTRSGDKEYVQMVDFKPAKARYVKLVASGGDENYAAAEIQVFGTKLAVQAASTGQGYPVKGYGQFQNQPGSLTDGILAPHGGAWDGPECLHWTELTTYFVIDLGKPIDIAELLVQADNNDDYLIEASADGRKYTKLLLIKESHGTAESGMDSFSSDAKQASFIEDLDFKPARARFLKISAILGDDQYALAEIQVVAAPPVVPVKKRPTAAPVKP